MRKYKTIMKKTLLYGSLSLLLLLFSAFLIFKSATNSNPELLTEKIELTPEFNDYWFSGKAEINTYQLKQARYGEYHEGIVESIFVTEPFLVNEQVKPDNWKDEREQVQVLKHNFLKKFGTGIYPYSMMLSTFTPLDQKQGLIKSTFSSQEWCGQVFGQLNEKNGAYKLLMHSYFEKEGDQTAQLQKVVTEDELWTRIRIDYQNLPVGEFDILPGFYHTRLTHLPTQIETASAALEGNETRTTYSIHFLEQDRKLEITFDTAFPHKIQSWKEAIPNRRNGGYLTTEATLDQSVNIDYWNYNSVKDKPLRDSLHLLY